MAWAKGIAIGVAALLAAGCASDRGVNPTADAGYRGLVGRECVVVLRADAVGGQNVTDNSATDENGDNNGNENGDGGGGAVEVVPGVLYGTLASISTRWVVLRSRAGNEYFVPREAVAVVSVARK